MGDDGKPEGAGVLQGPAHEHGVGHRVAVVGEPHRARGFLVAVFAQVLARRTHGDGPHRIDPGQARGRGLVQDIAGHRGGVVHRFGVGHGRHRGEAALDRGPTPGLDGLLVLLPGLPQVDVHVDEAGGHHQALGLDDPAPLPGDGPRGRKSRHFIPFDKQVP